MHLLICLCYLICFIRALLLIWVRYFPWDYMFVISLQNQCFIMVVSLLHRWFNPITLVQWVYDRFPSFEDFQILFCDHTFCGSVLVLAFCCFLHLISIVVILLVKFCLLAWEFFMKMMRKKLCLTGSTIHQSACCSRRWIFLGIPFRRWQVESSDLFQFKDEVDVCCVSLWSWGPTSSSFRYW